MTNRKDFTPRPYQNIALEHMLSRERSALWAGMGMGKTVSSLNMLDALYLSGEDHPSLILAPLRVARRTWPEEALKWNHLRHISIVPIVGPEKERLAALQTDASVYSINYDNLTWLIDHFGARWPFKTVIADESTRLKSQRVSEQTSSTGKTFYRSAGSKRAGALGKIAHLHIRRFIELTGTPAPNGLDDLWGQMWFLDGGRALGRTHGGFRERWFRPARNGYGVEPLPHAEQQIYDAIGDLALTLDPYDWFDIEEPFVNNVYVDLPAKARKLYKEMEKDLYIQIDQHHAEAFNAAAKTQKLLQLASGAVYVDPMVEDDTHRNSREFKVVHDEKIDALESIVMETNGAPLLVAYEFRSDLARLVKAFPRGRIIRTAQDEADFKAGKVPMAFLHPKSGGHGIDGFQEKCSDIVFFTSNWNLEDRMQIIERIGPVRQIQSNTGKLCKIHNIIARDTVEEDVIARTQSKKSVQDCLLEAKKKGHGKWQ